MNEALTISTSMLGANQSMLSVQIQLLMRLRIDPLMICHIPMMDMKGRWPQLIRDPVKKKNKTTFPCDLHNSSAIGLTMALTVEKMQSNFFMPPHQINSYFFTSLVINIIIKDINDL